MYVYGVLILRVPYVRQSTSTDGINTMLGDGWWEDKIPLWQLSVTMRTGIILRLRAYISGTRDVG